MRLFSYWGDSWYYVTQPTHPSSINLISVASHSNLVVGLPPLSLGGNLVRLPYNSTAGYAGYWTNVPAAVGNARAITYGAGYFVAVGDDGWITRSTNGTDWEL